MLSELPAEWQMWRIRRMWWHLLQRDVPRWRVLLWRRMPMLAKLPTECEMWRVRRLRRNVHERDMPRRRVLLWRSVSTDGVLARVWLR